MATIIKRRPTGFSNRTLLQAERGTALSCYERALFFADPVPNDRTILWAKLTTDRGFVANTTVIYSRARVILTERHKTVVNTYLDLRIRLQKEIMPDRDILAVFQSVSEVRRTSIILTNAAIKKGREAHIPVKEIVEDWKALNNICRLFMDEITHLTERIDSLSNALRTLQSVREAKNGVMWTLRFAMFTIIVSIVAAYVQIQIGRQQIDLAKIGSTEKSVLNVADQIKNFNAATTNALSNIDNDFHTLTSDRGDLKIIEAKLTAIDGDLSDLSVVIGSNQKFHNKPESIVDTLKIIAQSLVDVKKMITYNASSKDEICNKLDLLNGEITHLSDYVQSTPNAFKKLTEISAGVNKLNASVKELRAMIEKKQAPVVNKRAILNFGE